MEECHCTTGNIKSHWTLKTGKVPGKIKRREVELGLEVSPEEIMSWEVELG